MGSGIRKIRGYVFRKGFIWLGWLVEYKPSRGTIYYDDAPTMTVEPEYRLTHLVFGFTEKSVIKKLTKAI